MPYHRSFCHNRFITRPSNLLVLLCMLSCMMVRSQSIRDITTRDGLPQSFISGIVQDDSSFVWIASRNGLVRFDGLQYKLFQHDPYDSNSISSSVIDWLFKDNRNRLFLQSEARDIDIIDPVTEKVTHFIDHDDLGALGFTIGHKAWLIDVENSLWAITTGGGVGRYDKQHKQLTRFNSQTSGLPSDSIRGMLQSRNNNIWLISRQAISRYDRQTKRFTHWNIPFTQQYFTSGYLVYTILHERKNGELMWSDRTNLYIFNPDNGQFRQTTLPPGIDAGTSDIQVGYDAADYLEAGGSVFRYDDPSGFRSLGSGFGRIISFMVDRSGLIWLGTNGKGIRQIDLASPYFHSQPYKNGFTADLLRETMGLDMYKLFKLQPEGIETVSANYLFRSAYTPDKQLYLGLKETVVQYDHQRRTASPLPTLPKGIILSGLTVGPNGQPLVLDLAGSVLQYQPGQRNWETLVDSEVLQKAVGTTLQTQDILSDGKYLWIATYQQGLFRITLQNREVLHLKNNHAAHALPSDQLICLRQDPLQEDVLWIGSYQGLIALNKQQLSFNLYAVSHGLPDNTVYAILPDRDGNLWLTTNKGLCRFNPQSGQRRVFRSQHGLPGDEFNRHHQLQLPDGRLAFGGVDGWTIFDPQLMKSDEFDPPLAFTNIRINNKELWELPVKQQPAQALNALPEITLPYDLNSINIGFAALEYSQPHELQYRYQLAGFDENWIAAGNGRQANYTKLPPGEYTFTLNATNISGRWSSHFKTLRIIVSSPWWATRLAYLCYAIIIGGIVWTFIRLRVSRLVMEKEVDLRDKEAAQLKELDDMKTRFFSNITHEFRTPLTLIMGPAEQLKTAHANDPAKRQFSELIIKNARQLLNLVNRLLDLSRLEAKAFKLQDQEAIPGAIVGSIVHSFEMEAQRRELELIYKDKTDGQPALFYAEAVERIVYNLVSNALKFTAQGETVTITVEAGDSELLLAVRDTGIGIAESELPHIFDRFYQAGTSTGVQPTEAGSGIGLAMVKELVQQMNGNIVVESSVDKPTGTVFTITVPAKKINSQLPPALLPESAADTPVAGIQVLLVEDNAELAGFIVSILQDKYTVHHVTNGALGLEAALSMMPDLIITDIMMPVMDGMELLHKLRDDLRTNHIPVVILTAKTTREDMLTGLSSGAQEYLTKPFYPTELLLRLQNLLSYQDTLREKLQREIGTPTPGTIPAPEPVQDVFLTRLYEQIDEHLDDPLFGVDQLVETMNMSRSSLHRKLKTLTGLSTTEVVRNYRLKRAAAFLLEGYNSSDTAYRSGFGSPAYFSKCFREVYGMTPGDYIKEFRAASN
jgi:signal transduction histidine kinase/CheY-like chemotaxis protein/ligand-binding sensor domain-containing protein/AraC-like DNA-binding protein